MRRVLTVIALGAAVVGAVEMVGCGSSIVKGKVESAVRARLPEIIGPAQSYSVRAYGPALRMMRGKLDGLDITGTDVRLEGRVTIARLDVQIRGIQINTDTREIERADSTVYEATIAEAELSRYVAAKYPSIPSLRIVLVDGTISVLAKPGVSVVRVAVQGDADLQIRDQRVLALDVRKLRVAGINAPGFARSFLNSRLGVIFDTRDLGFDATIASVQIRSGSLTIAGSLDLAGALAKR